MSLTLTWRALKVSCLKTINTGSLSPFFHVCLLCLDMQITIQEVQDLLKSTLSNILRLTSGHSICCTTVIQVPRTLCLGLWWTALDRCTKGSVFGYILAYILAPVGANARAAYMRAFALIVACPPLVVACLPLIVACPQLYPKAVADFNHESLMAFEAFSNYMFPLYRFYVEPAQTQNLSPEAPPSQSNPTDVDWPSQNHTWVALKKNQQ